MHGMVKTATDKGTGATSGNQVERRQGNAGGLNGDTNGRHKIGIHSLLASRPVQHKINMICADASVTYRLGLEGASVGDLRRFAPERERVINVTGVASTTGTVDGPGVGAGATAVGEGSAPDSRACKRTQRTLSQIVSNSSCAFAMSTAVVVILSVLRPIENMTRAMTT